MKWATAIVLILAASVPFDSMGEVIIVPGDQIEDEPGVIPNSNQISGRFLSADKKTHIDFNNDGTFKYNRGSRQSTEYGAYEAANCTLSNTKTGEVLHRGNFIFYWNATSCCYDAKMIGPLFVLDRIWAKGKYSAYDSSYCPNLILKSSPADAPK